VERAEAIGRAMSDRTTERPLGKAHVASSITVFYDLRRCRHYAECLRGLPEVFDVRQRPWIRPDLADPEVVAEVVRRCPTGALHYRLNDGDAEEPTRPTEVTLDPKGPLLIRGDLAFQLPSGTMRETRAALCRCGSTANEPFCDGACGVDERHRSPRARR
jgi:uncharacterized Fe-S cluster protein YjdI